MYSKGESLQSSIMLRFTLIGSALIIGAAATCGFSPTPGNGGIALPDGFQAQVVADNLGQARQIALRENGDMYVSLMQPKGMDYLVALRDEDGDGVMDRTEYFGEMADRTKGLRLRGDWLYASDSKKVVRFPMDADKLLPTGPFEVVVSGFPDQRSHRDKLFTWDNEGNLYVDVGAPSNACQEQARTKGSMGLDPCPQLIRAAGVWKFPADQIGMTQMEHGDHFATGIRNAIAIYFDSKKEELYIVQHGRDQLHQLWGYTAERGAELPAEEFQLVREGSDFGWPYTYWDHFENKRMLAPEYGGDGMTPVEDGRFDDPIYSFPGHWAPNDLLFYYGDLFPERYRGGAFVAFHGSWNRAPLPQQGYNVVFLPFEGKYPSGEYEVFADGFKGSEVLNRPNDAVYRPTGLAVGPDGSLYISDSRKGRIWRVMYTGEGAGVAGKEAESVEEAIVAAPPVSLASLDPKYERLYTALCLACHQSDGSGVPGLQPPLLGSEALAADSPEHIITLMLKGSAWIEGSPWDNAMTGFFYLADEDIAGLLNYSKIKFAQQAGNITAADVAAMRKSIGL